MAEPAARGFVPGQLRASSRRGLDRFARDETASDQGSRSSARRAPACGLWPIVLRRGNARPRPPATRALTATTQSRVEATTSQRAAPGSDPARSSCWKGIGPTTDPIGALPLRTLRRWHEGSPARNAAARRAWISVPRHRGRKARSPEVAVRRIRYTSSFDLLLALPPPQLRKFRSLQQSACAPGDGGSETHASTAYRLEAIGERGSTSKCVSSVQTSAWDLSSWLLGLFASKTCRATRTLKTQRPSGFVGSSLASWMTCERTRLRPAPDLMSTWAAVPSPSQIRPSRMCSVPM